MNMKEALLILMVLSCALWVALYLKQWVAIDRCLDSGGSWNYEKSECDH